MKSFHSQIMDYAKSVGLHLTGESAIAVVGISSSSKDSTYSQKFKLLDVDYKTNHDLFNYHQCMAFFDRKTIDLVAYNQYCFHPIKFLTSYSISYSNIKEWKVNPTGDIDLLFPSGCMTIPNSSLEFTVHFVKHVNSSTEYNGNFDEFNQKLINLNANNK